MKKYLLIILLISFKFWLNGQTCIYINSTPTGEPHPDVPNTSLFKDKILDGNVDVYDNFRSNSINLVVDNLVVKNGKKVAFKSKEGSMFFWDVRIENGSTMYIDSEKEVYIFGEIFIDSDSKLIITSQGDVDMDNVNINLYNNSFFRIYTCGNVILAGTDVRVGSCVEFDGNNTDCEDTETYTDINNDDFSKWVVYSKQDIHVINGGSIARRSNSNILWKAKTLDFGPGGNTRHRLLNGLVPNRGISKGVDIEANLIRVYPKYSWTKLRTISDAAQIIYDDFISPYVKARSSSIITTQFCPTTCENYSRVNYNYTILPKDDDLENQTNNKQSSGDLDSEISVPEISQNNLSRKDLKQEEINRSQSVAIFPNPARDILTIRLADRNDSIRKLQVFDGSGMLLDNILLEKETSLHELNLSNYPTGAYYALIIPYNGEAVYKKFIKVE